MYYIRFRNGNQRMKILSENFTSCRRRLNAKMFESEQQAHEFAKFFGRGARVSGPVDPITRRNLKTLLQEAVNG